MHIMTTDKQNLPIPPSDSQEESVATLLLKFQRDINRTSDSDRMTRKRGLQKLLDDLPWKSNKQRASLEELFVTQLLGPLIAGVSDPVEKCRELSLSILKASFGIASTALSHEVIVRVTRCLCDRIGEVPFLETSEELRLQVIELITLILNHSAYPRTSDVDDVVLVALNKALTDTFPAAKRAGAELVCKLADNSPQAVRMCFKTLLKPLVGNALHQHSKTRSITVQAIGQGLSCVTEGDYETLMKETVLPLLSRMAGDRSGATRKELVNMSKTLLCRRLQTHGRKAIEANLPLSNLPSSSTKPTGGNYEKMTNDKATASNWITTGFSSSGGSNILGDAPTVCADLQLVALMLILAGDESDEVAVFAQSCLHDTAVSWTTAARYTPTSEDAMNIDITDGELEMQRAEINHNNSIAMTTATTSSVADADTLYQHSTAATTTASVESVFVCAYLYPVAKVISEGAGEWTTDTRRRNLRGLEVVIKLAGGTVECIVPQLLACLGGPIRDEDVLIRGPAEACCEALGASCATFLLPTSEVQTGVGSTVLSIQSASEWLPLDLLLPRVAGNVPGGDTFSQRASALRLLTHVFLGLSKSTHDHHPNNTNVPSTILPSSADIHIVAIAIATTLADYKLYEFREPALREAALLLVRALIDSNSSSFTSPPTMTGDSAATTTTVGSSSGTISGGNVGEHTLVRLLVIALIFLQTKCPGEEDIVPTVALREMHKLAGLVKGSTSNGSAGGTSSVGSNDKCVDALVGLYFVSILNLITTTSLAATALSHNSQDLYQWSPHSVLKAAFEVLIRQCPTQAWVNHNRVLDVIIPQVQPKKGPEAGSAEANMQSYASIRGEEALPASGEVDVRLSLLTLLESLVRAGSADWQCGQYIAAACERLLCKALIVQLVWRVGRVESTVRKVALAVSFGLMKAGAAKAEALAAAAPELVPLLCSNLDDHDETARLMSCLCLTVMFERLRGAFGDQAIHDLYPKLLKRLDDSSDAIRSAICSTLEMFLQAAAPRCYSGTMIDYTLDQLFIHLDDPHPDMQNTVYNVIITCARIDKTLLLKKAGLNRGSHRTPDMCDKIIFEVQGYQVLEES